ncbi:MAG: hypothetical protein EPO09_21675 [Aquabacterium sp.]|uniref:hypothetical protein n=1 Tax=Aquabacterium sp. TaxID=1872578 RepID=UPI00120CB4A5|nr:hypothetical protein [Aquabacterium sp.]TAK82209.1 MAG: hypothetical protein EPO09_21675 [Aquabacterium sp.]
MAYQLFRVFRFISTYLWRIVWAFIWPVAAPIATAIAKRVPVHFNLFLNGTGKRRPHLYRVGTGWYGVEWGFMNLEFFCPDEWDARASKALGL